MAATVQVRLQEEDDDNGGKLHWKVFIDGWKRWVGGWWRVQEREMREVLEMGHYVLGK